MSSFHPALAQFISMPGGGEWLIIAFIGLLLFGKRLPEVGRSLGRGIVEFKKGLRGIEDQIEDAVSRPPSEPSTPTYDQALPPAETPETPAVTEYHPAEATVEAHEAVPATEYQAAEAAADVPGTPPATEEHPTEPTSQKTGVYAGP